MRLSEESEAVDRLYHRLADALRQSRVEPFSSPVTVAEIYQELVPYRQVRDELGFSMNADYEHALLSLLAGEGGHVQLEPDSARDAIVRELKTPNPNVSIYREYAGCDVWVAEPAAGPDADGADEDTALDWLEDLDEEELGAAVSTFAFLEDEADAEEPARGESAGGDTPDAEDAGGEDAGEDQPWAAALDEPAAGAEPDVDALVDQAWNVEEPGPAREPAGAQEPQQDREPVRSEAGVNAATMSVAAGGTAGQAGEAQRAPHCLFCDSDLPGGRVVRFCPFCGSDQSKRPCGSCDEVLEEGWVYCIACGTPADAP